MKFFSIIFVLVCGTAQGGEFTDICANTAELAVVNVELAKAGQSWNEIVQSERSVRPGHVQSKRAKKMLFILKNIEKKAYYAWASLDEKTIRALAFSECEVEMQKAFP